MYMHFYSIVPTNFANAIYLSGHENNSTLFKSELYKQFPYDVYVVMIVCFAGELEILVLLDNSCRFSILQNILYHT